MANDFHISVHIARTKDAIAKFTGLLDDDMAAYIDRAAVERELERLRTQLAAQLLEAQAAPRTGRNRITEIAVNADPRD